MDADTVRRLLDQDVLPNKVRAEHPGYGRSAERGRASLGAARSGDARASLVYPASSLSRPGSPCVPRRRGRSPTSTPWTPTPSPSRSARPGTGKTYLAVAKAVRAFQDRRIRRIILTRPAVEAGESLGFLPGTNDKVDPYLRPLYDALSDMLGPDQLHRYLDDGTIEVAPLAYMRGRTLNDAYVILDEAQNTTEQQMKMFLTRLGFNADDDHHRRRHAGRPRRAAIRSGHHRGHSGRYIDYNTSAYLDAGDVVRHELVGRIVEAYDRHDATRVTRNRGKESREDAR